MLISDLNCKMFLKKQLSKWNELVWQQNLLKEKRWFLEILSILQQNEAAL